MYQILTSLAPAYNDRFTTLLFPTAIRINSEHGVLVLPHYEGEDPAKGWDESDGGARLDPGLAAAIPALLEDLGYVDTACVTTNPVLSKIPGLVFDHDAALARSRQIARRLTRAGLLTREACARAERLLAHHQRTPMIVNNGDFYPRNLIVQPTGRIVIIDWETYNPKSPFHTVDHPENVAAVFYVHMWGNPGWQALYRDALNQRFGYSENSFVKAVVIQALELANMWMDGTDLHLAAIQASTITSALG
jgi:Phosphotransferase enzyme family